MNCSKCTALLAPGAKFCPNCGVKVVSGDMKLATEVTIAWIDEVLKREGFSTEPVKGAKESIIAKKEGCPNLVINVVQPINLVTAQSYWSGFKVSWGQKSDFLNAIAIANTSRWLCSISTDKEMNNVTASGCMWLCETVTDRDMVGYLTTFGAQCYEALNAANLTRFTT